jgi:hypothetical protein
MLLTLDQIASSSASAVRNWQSVRLRMLCVRHGTSSVQHRGVVLTQAARSGNPRERRRLGWRRHRASMSAEPRAHIPISAVLAIPGRFETADVVALPAGLTGDGARA